MAEIEICLSDVQPLKMSNPHITTFEGIDICSNDEQSSKTFESIVICDDGSINTSVNDVHLENAFIQILLTDAGIDIFFNDVH